MSVQLIHVTHSCLVGAHSSTRLESGDPPPPSQQKPDEFSLLLGDLKNRADIKGGISLVIYNASRTDNGKYRCEVAAAEDQKRFAEITINLTVTGEDPHTREAVAHAGGHLH